MKLLLTVFVVFSMVALSYISIHAYEDTYMLDCEVYEDVREGLIEEVYASPVTLSSHPEAATGVFAAQTEAGGLMNRRDLQAPLWAVAQ